MGAEKGKGVGVSGLLGLRTSWDSRTYPLSGSKSNEGVAANGLGAGAVVSAAVGVCLAGGFDFNVMLRIRMRNTTRERLTMCCAVKKLRATRIN